MSLWGKLAGIGLGIAGGITANPGLIAAGASVFGSDVKASAAKKAQQSQEAAGERAIGIQQPYAQAGYGAITNLQGMIGRPTAAPVASQPMAQPSQPTNLAGMSKWAGNSVPNGKLIQAPNGEKRVVPGDQVAYWVQKGAKVVS